MTHLEDMKREVEAFHVYTLARMAGCMDPNSHESNGALLLTGVRDAVLDLYDPEAVYPEDQRSEIADGAPSVYNARRWSEFYDLGAWQEDPAEFGPSEDMTQAAGVALYMIAERLATALWELLDEARDEDNDEDEEV